MTDHARQRAQMRAAQAAYDDLSPDAPEEWEGECPTCDGITTRCEVDEDDTGPTVVALSCRECEA